MIEFFAKTYNNKDWKAYSECFPKYDIKVDGVSLDVVNPIMHLVGDVEWFNRPIKSLENKTAVELEKTEKGRKTLRAFIMRLPC